jgi:sulfatase modifying factor 1
MPRVMILLLALLSLPALAQTPDDAAANRLFVEAVQLWTRAEGEPVEQRPATLRLVQANLKTIIERHSGSTLAVRLVTGETVGQLSLAGIEREARRAFDVMNAAAGVGRILRDCPECPEIVVVPAGRFTMGAQPGEEETEEIYPEDVADPEDPVRSATRVEVLIPAPLAIGRFEVTRGEFALFVAETGHDTGSKCAEFEKQIGGQHAERTWRDPGFAQDERHPVACVSWDDAQAYVGWLAGKTGKGYRLLSEAEWEYAARAGTTTRRPWGDDAQAGCAHANIADAAARRVFGAHLRATECDDGHAYAAPVGTYRANAFGLHDMLGNAWEWTADCWNASHADAPADGSARTDGKCIGRVVRGGSWLFYPGVTRSAYRTMWIHDNRDIDFGFRVARTL